MALDFNISIMDLIQAVVAVLSAAFVVVELRRSANTTHGEFVLSLQEQYETSEGFAELFDTCWKYHEHEISGNDLYKYLEDHRTVLLNYFTFFESMYLMVTKKSLQMKDLDELFGRRFLSVANNKIVQEVDLIRNHDYYTNIFKLYKKWRKYRGENGNYFLKDDDGEDDGRYWDLQDAYESFWSKVQIRKLEVTDKESLEKLIGEIELTLQREGNKPYWLPISDISREHFLDDNWTIFMGAFLKQDQGPERLIGAMGLFLNANEYGKSCEIIGLKGSVAEFGRAMVHPEYRNKEVIGRLAYELLPVAKEEKIKYLLATVHPDNKPSWNFVSRIGFVKKGEKNMDTVYPRDILIREV
ncbi:Protein N-acetyltransferase, RimJ/RimL family [Lachnospiraceae bacterium XBD2001]|jgi:RimJ/RimL family protein N-acetyltransferase|nr:Protein N-acetyltransferase, RimJ/RimL family [Lachnospiraceae bacterium XBD2001]